MKKCKIVIVVAAFFSMFVGQALAQGVLMVDQSRLAFGTMKEGLVAQKAVTLSNTGDAAIKIMNVSTS